MRYAWSNVFWMENAEIMEEGFEQWKVEMEQNSRITKHQRQVECRKLEDVLCDVFPILDHTWNNEFWIEIMLK